MAENDQGATVPRSYLVPGSRWRHVASGRRYTVLGLCRDATNGRAFRTLQMVRYRDDALAEWVRAEVEFLDGRFEPL